MPIVESAYSNTYADAYGSLVPGPQGKLTDVQFGIPSLRGRLTDVVFSAGAAGAAQGRLTDAVFAAGSPTGRLTDAVFASGTVGVPQGELTDAVFAAGASAGRLTDAFFGSDQSFLGWLGAGGVWQQVTASLGVAGVWMPVKRYGGPIIPPPPPPPPPPGGPGPVRFTSLAAALAGLNTPQNWNYIMWPGNVSAGRAADPNLMIEEVMISLGASDVLVLPERYNPDLTPKPYQVYSADGFRAPGVTKVTNKGIDSPIVQTYLGIGSRSWFGMTRTRAGILGLGPDVIVEPAPSAFTRPQQGRPDDPVLGVTSTYTTTGGATVTINGCAEKVIEVETAGAYIGNFKFRSLYDFGTLAYNGITSNLSVTYENLDFNCGSRSFNTQPNGEASALGCNGSYKILNCAVETRDAGGVTKSLSSIMMNSAPTGGIMSNVYIPHAFGPTWWNCSGTHTVTALSSLGGGINLEAPLAGFVFNWTDGALDSGVGKVIHVQVRSNHGSQLVTLRNVTITGGDVLPSMRCQAWTAGADPTLQLRADVKRLATDGTPLGIVFNGPFAG